MHTRDDLSCARGYELWLIQQAAARNPDIITYSLNWGSPSWVGNGTWYSQDGIDYLIKWFKCIEQESGQKINLHGAWNEKPQPDADYVLNLRAALDSNGYSDTKLILMDGGYDSAEVSFAQQNNSYRQAVYGAGLHYPCNNPQPDVRDLGWTFLASEDYSRDPAWTNGAQYWSKALSQNYILMNMTGTISWSLIWSAYTNLVCNGAGLMRAHRPMSGNYEVSAPIWLTAHWTQFVKPGWRFLHTPGGGSGFIDVAGLTSHVGTYVTLVPETSLNGLTVIIETMQQDACLSRNSSSLDLTFTTRNGLPGPGTILKVWMTTSTAYFIQLSDIIIASDSTFSIHVPPDCMITLSTETRAQKGSFPSSPIPSDAPWPLPYSDNFNEYPYDSMAKYFSDQGGSWSVRNGTINQVAVGDPGPNGWAYNPDPLTQIGDESWIDYSISTTVTFSLPSFLQESINPFLNQKNKKSNIKRINALSERQNQWRNGKNLSQYMFEERDKVSDVPTNMVICDSSDLAQKWSFNIPDIGYLSNNVNFNQLCLNVGGCDPTSIIFYQCVDDPNGSSCGAPTGQYPNLVWKLDNTSGILSTDMAPTLALTINATNNALYLTTPQVGNILQHWTYNTSSMQLSINDLCLSTPPQKTYAIICGRVTTFDGFNAISYPGYCFQVDHLGKWSLQSNSIPIDMGILSSFNSQTPHKLTLSMAGDIIEAYVDGIQLSQVSNNDYSVGNVMIGSGWHEASFDDFEINLPL